MAARNLRLWTAVVPTARGVGTYADSGLTLPKSENAPAASGGPTHYRVRMSRDNDTYLAARFAKACADARAYLLREMEAAGLHASEGWKIVETMRQVAGGSELIMRPLHLHRPSPPGLECVVKIDLDTTAIDSTCG